MSEVQIHPTAIISSHATLGAGVQVGAYSVIEDDVVIGDGTEIAYHAVIASGARIGKHCKIFSGASISTVPQDLKFKGEPTHLYIGDHTTVREYATLNRGTMASGKTSIGSNCLIMAYAHIAHDCIVGNHVILANAVQLGGHCEIDDYAFVGGLVGMHQFTRVGKHAMIGGVFRAVVDVPPFVTAGREPLRYEGVNVTGLKRRGFTSEQIDTLRDIYRIIFQSKLLLANAIEKVKADIADTAERDEVLRFFETAGNRRFLRA